MKRALGAVAVVVVFTPMLVMLLILLAVNWPRMDAITMHMPMGLRQTVASAAMKDVGYGKDSSVRLKRVQKLDPANDEVISRVCSGGVGDPVEVLKNCRIAVARKGDWSSWNGLGNALEKTGDECGANDAFTRASAQSSAGSYSTLEKMGRAALICGDVTGSRAGFETAIDNEQKSLKDEENEADDIAEIKSDMVSDREYLVVVYGRLHEGVLAKKACSEAHPDWKGCSCGLDADRVVKCEEAK